MTNSPEVKSNLVGPNDEDFTSRLVKMIREQLIENDPEYDGSELILNGRKTNDNRT